MEIFDDRAEDYYQARGRKRLAKFRRKESFVALLLAIVFGLIPLWTVANLYFFGSLDGFWMAGLILSIGVGVSGVVEAFTDEEE